MKVLIDENLSPAIARALQALFPADHIIHLRDRFPESIKDVDWIDELGKEGGWIVISGDRRITRSRIEAQAFRSSQLIGFFLAKGLYKAKVAKQAERLLAMWERIGQQAQLVEGGAMFEVQMKSARLSQLK